MKTRVGTIELLVPRVRNGEFSPELFDRYQRNEQAFVIAMMEMFIQSLSSPFGSSASPTLYIFIAKS